MQLDQFLALRTRKNCQKQRTLTKLRRSSAGCWEAPATDLSSPATKARDLESWVNDLDENRHCKGTRRKVASFFGKSCCGKPFNLNSGAPPVVTYTFFTQPFSRPCPWRYILWACVRLRRRFTSSSQILGMPCMKDRSGVPTETFWHLKSGIFSGISGESQ